MNVKTRFRIAISVDQHPKRAFKVEPQRLEGKVDFSKRLLVGPMFARINNESLHAEPGYCEHKKAYITQKGEMRFLPSHLRCEPEEGNVASSVIAMGRSGVASRSVYAGRMPTLPCTQISIDAQHLTGELRRLTARFQDADSAISRASRFQKCGRHSRL